MNHWIALFLTGRHPGYREPFNKLEYLDLLFEFDPRSFSEDRMAQLKNHQDYDFYLFTLDTLQKKCRDQDEYQSFLKKIKVPREIVLRSDEEDKKYDQDLLKSFLTKCNETELGENLVTPLLKKLGYQLVHFKGTVRETDNGLDYFVMFYEAPSGSRRFVGVQLKAISFTGNGTTGKKWQDLKSEINDAFKRSHIIPGSSLDKVFIDELIVITSGRFSDDFISIAREEVKEYKCNVDFFDQNWLLSQLLVHKLPASIDTNIKRISKNKR